MRHCHRSLVCKNFLDCLRPLRYVGCRCAPGLLCGTFVSPSFSNCLHFSWWVKFNMFLLDDSVFWRYAVCSDQLEISVISSGPTGESSEKTRRLRGTIWSSGIKTQCSNILTFSPSSLFWTQCFLFCLISDCSTSNLNNHDKDSNRPKHIRILIVRITRKLKNHWSRQCRSTKTVRWKNEWQYRLIDNRIQKPGRKIPRTQKESVKSKEYDEPLTQETYKSLKNVKRRNFFIASWQLSQWQFQWLKVHLKCWLFWILGRRVVDGIFPFGSLEASLWNPSEESGRQGWSIQ